MRSFGGDRKARRQGLVRGRRRAACWAALLMCLASLVPPAFAAAAPSKVVQQVRAYRQAHEKQIVGELHDLLALRNVATVVPDINRNAAHLQTLLRRRGFKTEIIDAGQGTPPSVFAELRVPGAGRTVVFYAHFDGQPAGQPGWKTEPWTPTVKAGEAAVDWRNAARLDPEWRIYARSASDDKSPIIALLAALDALKASGRAPAVNVKVFLEGEEEQGSPNLGRLLARHKKLLAADAWIMADGPIHQNGNFQIFYGARGAETLELTLYGPLRPLHSGHYGNWAPNPAVMAAELVASMRDAEGRILIPNFHDDVRPVTEAERRALAALPDVESGLRKELALGRTEGDERLMNSIMRPALNVRGIRAGDVGKAAANAVPAEAHISMDFRLVPGQTPQHVRDLVLAHLASRGWTVMDREPTALERNSHPRVAWARWGGGYAAYRADMELPVAKAVTSIVRKAASRPMTAVPMLGGSVPMSLIGDTLLVPVIGVPMVNYDNNQHAANENLRLQNLWDGIEIYGALLAELNW